MHKKIDLHEIYGYFFFDDLLLTVLNLDLANTDPAMDFFFAPNLPSLNTFDASFAFILWDTVIEAVLFFELLDIP